MDTNYFIFLGAVLVMLLAMGAYATHHDRMRALNED